MAIHPSPVFPPRRRTTLVVGLACVATFVPPAAAAQTTLPPVTVTMPAAEARHRSASLVDLFDVPLADAPLAVTSLEADAIEARAGLGLAAVLRGAPGVTDSYNTVGYVESFAVRGFVLDSLLNFRRNGLPASSFAPLGLENVARIEVLRGTAALLAGTGAPGGAINLVAARPTEATRVALTGELSERGSARVHADFGGRLGDGAIGYRINLAGAERRPAAQDAEGTRALASAFLEARLPGAGRIEWEAQWQRVRQISVPGFGLIDRDGDGFAETLPPPISPRVNLNRQPWTQPYRNTQLGSTLRWEQPLARDWRASAAAGVQRLRSDDRIAFPDGCSSGPAFVYPGLCGNYDVDLYDFRSNDERRNTVSLEAKLDGRVSAFGAQHGVSLGVRSTRYAERTPPAQAYNYVGTINAFAPAAVPPDPVERDLNTQRDDRLREAWLAARAQLTPALALWLGTRATDVERRSARTDGSRALAAQQRFDTPWAALTLKAGETLWFASAGGGIELQVVPNRPRDYANAGATLPAERNRMIEAGVRRASGPLRWELVAFQIERPQPDDLPQADGRALRVAGARLARHRGVEAEAAWTLSSQWQASVQGTLLDARLARAVDAGLVDRRATNVPPWTLGLALDWRPAGASGPVLANRARAAGRKPVTPDNAVELATQWQWDLEARWTQRAGAHAIDWRFGVDNLTGRAYWREAPTQPWGASYLFPAQPRTLRLAATVTL